MCLDYKNTKKELKEWLEEQPDIITAYKLVTLVNERIYPWVQSSKGYFKRENLLRKELPWFSPKYVECDFGEDKYMAYYHLLLNKPEVHKQFGEDCEMVECRIPKKYVTDIGSQWCCKTVITIGFTIVGQDEYLKE